MKVSEPLGELRQIVTPKLGKKKNIVSKEGLTTSSSKPNESDWEAELR